MCFNNLNGDLYESGNAYFDGYENENDMSIWPGVYDYEVDMYIYIPVLPINVKISYQNHDRFTQYPPTQVHLSSNNNNVYET